MEDEPFDPEAPRPRPRVVDKRRSAQGAQAPPPTAPDDAASASSSDGPAVSPTQGATEPPVASPPPEPSGSPEPPRPEERVWTPEQEAEAARIAQEIASTPSLDWIVNVAMTLVNVAGTKIEMGDASDAGPAIDALAGLLDGAKGRLSTAETPLRQALAQLQLAYASTVSTPPQPG